METLLAANIRMYRKQMSLTREQLAEALGVTAGAIYKWEAKLSVPELGVIVEMADFFDISVDALLGYEMKDNRLAATVQRLKKFHHDKDPAGMAEAEKALKKYPNAFEVVYESAAIYRSFGVESGKKEHALRALELLQASLPLLSQNADPEIGELTIYGSMADVYQMLDDRDKALEILKRHNVGRQNNDRIGIILSENNGSEEAVPFLSESLVIHVTALVHTALGYLNVYLNRNDYAASEDILKWITGTLSGLRRAETPSYLEKINSLAHACLAFAQAKTGQTDKARDTLKTALAIARAFDAAPNYDGNAVRFVEHPEHLSAYDDLGATAMESVERTIESFEDEAFSTMWKAALA